MTDQPAPAHTCAICQRRPYERAQVCDGCRRWLRANLAEVADLARLLPAAVAPSRSIEGGIPLRLSAVDLSLPSTGGAGTVTVHDPYRDQAGEIPVAARLDSWAQDWLTHDLGEHRPVPTVTALVAWLTVRLRDACDTHPAVDEFATEIRTLLSAMRRALDTNPPPAVRYEAPCPRCATKTLRRCIGADWIECDTCGRLWGEDDYAELTAEAIPAHTLLTASQAATMCGVTRDAIYKLVSRGKLVPLPGPWGARMLFAKSDLKRQPAGVGLLDSLDDLCLH